MGSPFTDITLSYGHKDIMAKTFTYKQNAVSDAYVNHLDRYKPPKTSRITVGLIDVNTTKREPFYFGSILHCESYFDKDIFWSLGIYDQRKMILDIVHTVAIDCAKKFSWDVDRFEKAYQKVIDDNLEYRREGKKLSSKDRKLKASILLEKDETSASISVKFFKKDGENIKTVKLFSTHPNYIIYESILKCGKWLSNNEFGFSLRSNQIVIKINVEKEEPELIITPTISDKEYLEGFWGFLTLKEELSAASYFKWLPKELPPQIKNLVLGNSKPGCDNT